MDISVLDASNYFRGLLLLIRQDRILRGPEIYLMQRICRALGFERVFCENAIRDILENKYISEAFPAFSSKVIAEKFIIDGLTIALTDSDVHQLEEQWLISAAEANGIDAAWIMEQKERISHNRSAGLILEADRLTVRHGQRGTSGTR